MFGFLKNKSKISRDDLIFLDKIVGQLPTKYEYLLHQINAEFLIGKEPNILGKGKTYTILLNANLEHQYVNHELPNLIIIKDILVWNKITDKNEIVELHIVQGMLAGYRLDCDSRVLDLDRISMSHVKEKNFLNKEKHNVDKLFINTDPEVLARLDIENTFKISIHDKDYFVIKDLGDGNYISVDNLGKVYGMIHDPYEIDALFESIEGFVSELMSGRFDFSSYINNKG
ncbi:hypothetical protein [Pedobacter sp.]|uniref:hypothetical protein n=1 Tax=Pedobacter sp. TaxID=1411316 RepID=UPI003BA8C3F0